MATKKNKMSAEAMMRHAFDLASMAAIDRASSARFVAEAVLELQNFCDQVGLAGVAIELQPALRCAKACDPSRSQSKADRA